MHPYKTAPPRAFWSRSVSTNFDPADVADPPPFRLTAADSIMSAGSCFGARLRPYLEQAGLRYTVTERAHPLFPESAESPFYEAFSARYGNIYTARQMAQLLERALGRFRPVEDHWQAGDEWIDPFRPGLRHKARSLAELRLLTEQHLAAVRIAIIQSSVLVFTLGLTEAWLSKLDGAVFPACPGTVAGEFDPERHALRNFTVDEVTADLVKMVLLSRELNPELKVILTVSPVSMVATATGRHVLVASTYSKSVLRVAADQARLRLGNIAYFPAYELSLGAQAPYETFDENRRTVSEPAVAAVMDVFFATYADGAAAPARPRPEDGEAAQRDRRERERQLQAAVEELVEAECEEEMADELLTRP